MIIIIIVKQQNEMEKYLQKMQSVMVNGKCLEVNLLDCFQSMSQCFEKKR
jgi:hypothetical protein